MMTCALRRAAARLSAALLRASAWLDDQRAMDADECTADLLPGTALHTTASALAARCRQRAAEQRARADLLLDHQSPRP